MEWNKVEDAMPDTGKYTDVLIAITNGEREWVVADRYDGYSCTFEDNYYPDHIEARVYKWRIFPSVPEL